MNPIVTDEEVMDIFLKNGEIMKPKEKEITLLDIPKFCLWCGKEKKSSWDNIDDEFHYRCDCPDAKRDREITEQIYELECSRPKPKFRTYQKIFLGEEK